MSTRKNKKSRIVNVRVSFDLLTSLETASKAVDLPYQTLLKRYIRNGLIRDGHLSGTPEETKPVKATAIVEPVLGSAKHLNNDIEDMFRS